jgi:DNA-binding response OmpR family regulator
MVISALDGEDNRIKGIEMGADDYLTKPFSPREVVSRVGSLLRRTSRLLDEGPATGDELLSIVEHCLRITLLGRQLTVSQSEWKLWQLLCKRHWQIVSVEELAGLIWSESEFLRHRDLDDIIATLNTKLCNACAGSIEVVPTIGYRLLPPRATT